VDKPGYETIPDAARIVGRSIRHVRNAVNNHGVLAAEGGVYPNGLRRQLVSMRSLKHYERTRTVRKARKS